MPSRFSLKGDRGYHWYGDRWQTRRRWQSHPPRATRLPREKAERSSPSMEDVELLLAAAESGDAERVRLLIGAGTPVDSCRADGSSALLLAALGGHSRCCSR